MSGYYRYAEEILHARRDARRAALDERKNEVFAKIPRLKEINRELDLTGMRMLDLVASGAMAGDDAAAKIAAENRAYNDEIASALALAGYEPDYLNEKFICGKCSDTGYVDGKLCTCLKKELTAIALHDANLTAAMANCTFRTFRLDYYSGDVIDGIGVSPRTIMEAALNVSKNFVKNFDRDNGENLLFYGGCGLGKTFLSSAIANALIERGSDVFYVSANTIFPILEDIHFGREVSEENSYLAHRVTDADLLILDDLGSEFVTAFTVSELFGIINTRLNNRKKMVINTNLSPDGIEATYSERIASRILGCFATVQFMGEDLRKKNK